MKAVFLSASVPDPAKKHFIAPADPIDIAAAVKSFVYAVLGRRKLIWGGHPAITPMVWSVAKSMGVDYGSWVSLYQTKYFKDDYPEDNDRFKNVTYTDVPHLGPNATDSEKLAASLLVMRETMFSENEFETAIFIGGMEGVVDEFDLIGKFNRDALRVPILSTGGATRLLSKRVLDIELDLSRLERDVDYVPLFYDLCGIEPNEPRGLARD